MALKHFITHGIAKLEKEPAAKVTMSDQDGVADEDSPLSAYYQRATKQLKGILMQRSGKRYGVFSHEAPVFQGLLKDWQKGGMSFQSWARRCMEQLAAGLDNTDFLVDGYLAFFHESLEDSDRLYLFHLRYKDSVTVNSDLSLSETRYLDFSNTGFGLCINLTDWQQDSDSKYITFSFGRGDRPLQNQILSTIGFTDTLNTAAETEEFLSIVDEYSRTLPAAEAFAYKSKVVDFCIEQDMRGEAVDFDELDQHLSAEMKSQPGEAFSHYLIEKKKERQKAQKDTSGLTPEQLVELGAPMTDVAEAVKSELIPDRKKLKGFIRYSGKNKEISLSFSASLLGEGVEFNQQEKSLLIRQVPESLLKQLSGKKDEE
ncbi:nucleoid-associated protein [Thalassolituus sp.]|uniref:nucleoid-associated protein n=1 Tax=Thalassolituus sp. TaxID=2030822 RepID=UPI003519B310